MHDHQTDLEAKLEHELRVFFNNDKVKLNDWLDTPIPRLGGQSPRSMFATNEKRAELLQVLEEMKFGDTA